VDESRNSRKIERELLLLAVATVVLDSDEVLHDEPLDLCDAHGWWNVRYPIRASGRSFRSAAEGAAALAWRLLKSG